MGFGPYFSTKKSSNKLRIKALVGWNTLNKVPGLINMILFFTRRQKMIWLEGI